MAKKLTLFCHKHGGAAEHTKVKFSATTNGPGETALAVYVDMVDAATLGATSKTFGSMYECSACGHFRSNASQCSDSRC